MILSCYCHSPMKYQLTNDLTGNTRSSTLLLDSVKRIDKFQEEKHVIIPPHCTSFPGQCNKLHSDYYYVGDGTQGWYFSYTEPYPSTDYAYTTTAEWIVEQPCPEICALTDFQSVTFYGMGDTQGNGTYTGPYWQTHDYAILCRYLTNIPFISLGPLNYDTTYGPPNDSNTIYWILGY